jgi:predicted Fe-Mo cluster-binding NifX family protein
MYKRRKTMLRILIIILPFVLIFQPSLVGEESEVIAVAAEGETLEAAVSQLAARCPYFLIVDHNGDLREAVENPYKNNKGKAGVSAANFLAEKDVTIVVAGNCGSNMKDALAAQEIEFFEFEGIAAEAIKKILEK